MGNQFSRATKAVEKPKPVVLVDPARIRHKAVLAELRRRLAAFRITHGDHDVNASDTGEFLEGLESSINKVAGIFEP